MDIYKRLTRNLPIEEALQIEIKYTLSQNNKSYEKWYDISYEKQFKTHFRMLYGVASKVVWQ